MLPASCRQTSRAASSGGEMASLRAIHAVKLHCLHLLPLAYIESPDPQRLRKKRRLPDIGDHQEVTIDSDDVHHLPIRCHGNGLGSDGNNRSSSTGN